MILLRRSHLAADPTPETWFGRSAPLVLEVGFGDGRFLVHLARRHPDWNLLGVEVSLASVSRAFRRLRRERVDSVRIVHGHARFVVRDILAPGSLARIYVNFPDPWPRKRHRANRLLQRDFFRTASNRLAPGGRILLTTDHEEYFGFALDEARESGMFDAGLGPPPDGALDTKYALKWKEEDRSTYHVTWTARGAAPDPTAHPISIPMQHALMEGDLDRVGPFEKQVRRYDGGTAIVTEAFRVLEGSGLMFLVVAEEPDLRQELLVKAWPKEDGVFVGLQPFGDPVATRGAREAVQAVVNWLEAQGLSVVRTWI